MSWWNDGAQWVSDENGLRWYFSERDPGGPSRLECYRRLLGEPMAATPRLASPLCVVASALPLRRLAEMFEVAKKGWRGQPAVQHELAGR